MYAGSAFVVIQVIDILTNRLNLPAWIATLAIIILSVGFPVTAILAWIFDLTPEGIKKTESLNELAGKEIITPLARRRLKVGDLVIFVLAIAVIVLAWPKIFKKDPDERLKSSGEKLSVAAMPFQNLTNDKKWDVWQKGIQLSLTNTLSLSAELKIKPIDLVSTLLQKQGVEEYASIPPAIAAYVSRKLSTDIFITGNIQEAGSVLRLSAQMIDTRTKDIWISFEISGSNDEKRFLISLIL